MEFRNFDKIGLKTQYEIRRFLGEGIISKLERIEYLYDYGASEALRKNGVEKFRFIVGLVQKESEEGLPVLAIIRPCIYRMEICYLVELLEPTQEKGYYERSCGGFCNDINKVIELLDSFYGATTRMEILKKARQFQNEEEYE